MTRNCALRKCLECRRMQCCASPRYHICSDSDFQDLCGYCIDAFPNGSKSPCRSPASVRVGKNLRVCCFDVVVCLFIIGEARHFPSRSLR